MTGFELLVFTTKLACFPASQGLVASKELDLLGLRIELVRPAAFGSSVPIAAARVSPVWERVEMAHGR